MRSPFFEASFFAAYLFFVCGPEVWKESLGKIGNDGRSSRDRNHLLDRRWGFLALILADTCVVVNIYVIVDEVHNLIEGHLTLFEQYAILFETLISTYLNNFCIANQSLSSHIRPSF